MARDRESGDATFATVVVDVLSEGQSSKDTLKAFIHRWHDFTQNIAYETCDAQAQ